MVNVKRKEKEMGFEFLTKLPTPAEIRSQYPVSQGLKELKAGRDRQIRDILTGKDSRFLAIIGPCSADNEEAVIDSAVERSGAVADCKEPVDLFSGRILHLSVCVNDQTGKERRDLEVALRPIEGSRIDRLHILRGFSEICVKALFAQLVVPGYRRNGRLNRKRHLLTELFQRVRCHNSPVVNVLLQQLRAGVSYRGTVRITAPAHDLVMIVRIKNRVPASVRLIGHGGIALSIGNILGDKALADDILKYVRLLLFDAVTLLSGAAPRYDAELSKKLSARFTRKKLLDMIELTESSKYMLKQNININLLTTRLCGEYRRISWQR